MISEVAEVKNQHESVCDEGCPENCEYCEDEGGRIERRTQHWLRLDQEAHLIHSCSSVQLVASPTRDRDHGRYPKYIILI
jgi:hypothetical protein